MREIGGYFELDTREEPWHTGALELNSGRNCLRYLIRRRNINEIWIPYYICSSVIEVCNEENCKIKFYHILSGFTPELKTANDTDWVYVVNYFGQLKQREIRKYQKQFKNMILDNSQDFFRKPTRKTNVIYNCRKFFGVPDGAYLYTDTAIEANLERDYSSERMKHVLGRIEKGSSIYYETFRRNEVLIGKLPLLKMSSITVALMGNLNYKKIKKIRTSNIRTLHFALKRNNQYAVKAVKGAFMYPFFSKCGEQIREKLISNKIYIPKLWPEVEENYKKLNDFEVELCKKLVCIPCDQRYGKKEMKYVIKQIIEFI